MDFSKLVKDNLNYNLTDLQLKQFQDYYELLVSYNKKVNLTRITTKEEVYIKHFYDSIAVINDYDFTNVSLCDMGSGAGFPGIPLKILYPNIKLTIVDASLKRLNFLEVLIKKLNLDDVELIHDRLENLKNIKVKAFDVCTARAVSTLSNMTKWGTQSLKDDGVIIVYKAKNYQEEVLEFTKKNPDHQILKVSSFELPNKLGSRNNFFIASK